MEYLKIQALVVYTVSVIMVQSCPLNCICDEYRTVCQVKTCKDELPFDYTDYLVIDGPLCVNQLMFLNALSPNTIIVMRTHSCEGLRNCRNDGVLPTQIPRESSPTEMFSEDDFIPDIIPVPIPGHVAQPEGEVIPEIEQPEVVPEIQPEVVPEIEPEPEIMPEIQPEPEPEAEVEPEVEQPEVEVKAETEIEQPITEATTTTEGTTEETTKNALVPIEEEDDDSEGNNSTISIYRG